MDGAIGYMKKFLVIVILFTGLMLVSVAYSGRVYRFYIKFYYNIFYSEDEIVKKGWELYDGGRYNELHDFIEPILEVYVWNNDIKKIAGLNFIKLGEPLKGADLYASSFENGNGESGELIKVLRILFRNGDYGEIVYFYDRNILRNNVNVAFYYGASLYYQGRSGESLESLAYARENGFIGEEIDYYTGLAYEKEGRLKEAAYMLQKAYNSNRYNKDIKSALIRVYRQKGDFEMAEMVIRKK